MDKPNPNSATIRQMTLDDVAGVHVLETKCFSTPWSKDAFVQELSTNKLARYMLYELSGEIYAYGGYWVILEEAHITNIAVDPEKRRLGIGRTLVSAMLETMQSNDIKKVTLEVRDGNTAARRLYESFGFKEAGIRPDYYQEPKEDAIIMWLDLD
jgi:ribosomal-protein-alanine N-acetyltransferase